MVVYGEMSDGCRAGDSVRPGRVQTADLTFSQYMSDRLVQTYPSETVTARSPRRSYMEQRHGVTTMHHVDVG